MECWGASSQVNTAWYGYGYPDDGGGYTKGDAKLEARNCLYICVGGVGIANNPSAPQGRNWGGFGGYNGGSNPRNGVNRNYLGGCGGGGATHIGFKKQLLSAFTEDYATQLIMVAGGRGGDCYDYTGGYGGGDTAGACTSYKEGAWVATNYDANGNFIGPQDTNVPNWYHFGYGIPGMMAYDYGNGGGGGGFWGGYATYYWKSSGGGGTGFVNKTFLDSEAKTIAGNELFNSPIGVQERGHKGHGAAKISWEAKKCFNP